MRLGILGGTFDPVHVGHLWMAEAARDQLQLDRVFFVPASRPPHKEGRRIRTFEERIAMLRLALDDVPGMQADATESDPARPSYTATTLKMFHGRFPGSEFWLVIGGDSLRDLPTWRRPEVIARLARFAVLPRPGVERSIPDVATGRVDWLSGPQLHISSTAIRERLSAGRSVRFLVPEPARRRIQERQLYREE